MNYFYKNINYVLLSTGILLLDRSTKYAALRWLASSKDITSFLGLKLVINYGISWGFFATIDSFYRTLMRIGIIVLINLLSIYMIDRYRKHKSIYAEIAILTGALCNLFDRSVYGGVIDFIHLHYGAWSWPIFNIADVAIVGGVLWMICCADAYEL